MYNNIVKIEHIYNLPDAFSNISFDKAWDKLIDYLQNNRHLLNNIILDKENSTIKIQSINYNSLIDIIKKVDPSGYFNKNLIRTIRLNLKFNHVNKMLELSNENNDNFENLNTIEYTLTFENKIKNDLYFHESSLLINYENIHKDKLKNSKYKLSIIFFDKVENGNEDEFENHFYILCIYDMTNSKFIFIPEANENNEFNYEDLIIRINNNYVILNSNYDHNDLNGNLIQYKNFRKCITDILLLDASYDSILLFKKSVNNYIFENFIKDQYKVSRSLL